VNHSKIVHSVQGISRTHSTFVDFQSQLQAGLSQGNYYFIIKEKIWNYAPEMYSTFRDICEKFSLSVQILETIDNGEFKVYYSFSLIIS
jgi:hypothetical protein